MRYDSPVLADLARGGGFTDAQIPTAVACAYAATGGESHYHRTIGGGRLADYRGLWAVNVVQYPELSDVDLWDVYVAARAAKQLTDDVGGFAWCYAYRTRAHARHVAKAATAATRVKYRQPQRTINAVPAADVNMARRLDHLAHLRARITRHRHR